MYYNPFNPNDVLPMQFNMGNVPPNLKDHEASLQDEHDYELEQELEDERIQREHDLYDTIKEQDIELQDWQKEILECNGENDIDEGGIGC